MINLKPQIEDIKQNILWFFRDKYNIILDRTDLTEQPPEVAEHGKTYKYEVRVKYMGFTPQLYTRVNDWFTGVMGVEYVEVHRHTSMDDNDFTTADLIFTVKIPESERGFDEVDVWITVEPAYVDAKVTLTNTSSNVTYQTSTDTECDTIFEDIPRGEYEITVEAENYYTEKDTIQVGLQNKPTEEWSFALTPYKIHQQKVDNNYDKLKESLENLDTHGKDLTHHLEKILKDNGINYDDLDDLNITLITNQELKNLIENTINETLKQINYNKELQRVKQNLNIKDKLYTNLKKEIVNLNSKQKEMESTINFHHKLFDNHRKTIFNQNTRHNNALKRITNIEQYLHEKDSEFNTPSIQEYESLPDDTKEELEHQTKLREIQHILDENPHLTIKGALYHDTTETYEIVLDLDDEYTFKQYTEQYLQLHSHGYKVITTESDNITDYLTLKIKETG